MCRTVFSLDLLAVANEPDTLLHQSADSELKQWFTSHIPLNKLGTYTVAVPCVDCDDAYAAHLSACLNHLVRSFGHIGLQRQNFLHLVYKCLRFVKCAFCE